MKNVIRLDIVHSEKERIETFLNNVDADLEQIPFAKHELRGVDDIVAGFKFDVKDRLASIVVILASSYTHAAKIEALNLPTSPNIKWTINGSVLFGVESMDKIFTEDLLGFFAGKE